MKKEAAYLIGVCLENLEVERRLVLTARYLEDVSLQDLASGFSCTPQAIHYREKQALSQMRKCLEKNGWHWDGSEEEVF